MKRFCAHFEFLTHILWMVWNYWLAASRCLKVEGGMVSKGIKGQLLQQELDRENDFIIKARLQIVLEAFKMWLV